MKEEIIDEEEMNRRTTKSEEDMIELSKDIAEHIHEYERATEVFHEPSTRFDILRMAAEVKQCLENGSLSETLENRLLKDFKEQVAKEGGIEMVKEKPFLRKFGEIGIRLNKYNINLLEKSGLKELLYNDLAKQDKDVLELADISVDNFKNISWGEGDLTITVGTKGSMLSYFKKELEFMKDLYKDKPDEIKVMEESIKKNINTLSIYKGIDILVAVTDEEGSIHIRNDEESLNTLEDILLKVENEKENMEDYNLAVKEAKNDFQEEYA